MNSDSSRFNSLRAHRATGGVCSLPWLFRAHLPGGRTHARIRQIPAGPACRVVGTVRRPAPREAGAAPAAQPPHHGDQRSARRHGHKGGRGLPPQHPQGFDGAVSVHPEIPSLRLRQGPPGNGCPESSKGQGQ
ncbi:hypothetical protein LV35_04202 [Acinetobacter baumannii]|uniref:Uncharacterized protein n=1 Tax=Acinetobacter baumannii TaxID=470 RepID=A0AAJ0VMI4_ACIBA|nr:hypothetical protein LV35_04202 [Acinetobacter baumannii]